METACHDSPETEEQVREIATIIHRNLTNNEKTHVGPTWVNCFLKWNSNKLKKSWATPQSMLQGAAVNEGSIDHFELFSKTITEFWLCLSFCWPWMRVTPSSTSLQGDSRSLELPKSEHRHHLQMKTGNQSPSSLLSLLLANATHLPLSSKGSKFGARTIYPIHWVQSDLCMPQCIWAKIYSMFPGFDVQKGDIWMV